MKMDTSVSMLAAIKGSLDIFRINSGKKVYSSKVVDYACFIFCLAGMGGDILC